MAVWFLTLMATIERVILAPIRNICFLVLFLYEVKIHMAARGGKTTKKEGSCLQKMKKLELEESTCELTS